MAGDREQGTGDSQQLRTPRGRRLPIPLLVPFRVFARFPGPVRGVRSGDIRLLSPVTCPLSPGVQMPQFRRTDRLNEQLRQEIILLLRDEVRDPRVALATVTAVQTSPELDHAKV